MPGAHTQRLWFGGLYFLLGSTGSVLWLSGTSLVVEPVLHTVGGLRGLAIEGAWGGAGSAAVMQGLSSCPLSSARLFCPWDSLGKNTGVGCHFFLQGIFLTQRSNKGLLIGRGVLYHHATREALTFLTAAHFLSLLPSIFLLLNAWSHPSSIFSVIRTLLLYVHLQVLSPLS